MGFIKRLFKKPIKRTCYNYLGKSFYWRGYKIYLYNIEEDGIYGLDGYIPNSIEVHMLNETCPLPYILKVRVEKHHKIWWVLRKMYKSMEKERIRQGVESLNMRDIYDSDFNKSRIINK